MLATAMCFTAQSIFAPVCFAQEDPGASKQVYPRSYFDPYNPQTARDMIDRLPGFTLDLGDDIRGFGAGAGRRRRGARARERLTGFRVHFPREEAGAWTVAAATISGDIADPRRDRTMHVDRHTGAILADVGFQDYSLMGKAMAAGVPLHQGDLGSWNIVLNVVFCFAVIAMIVSGIVMWWLRRPKKGLRLAPPPSNERVWRYGALCMLGVSALFPLTAATLAVVIVADFLVFSRMSRLAMLLK